ncbi:MAG: ECF transporter S component [Clostridiales bacterium]|nr:ECF transporter S component [Clostridiales bacterium]
MKSKLSVKFITLCGVFIALSVVGAFIKPFGSSIAFDSLPAFLAASMLGPIAGAITGLLGHLISSAIVGFPFTLPVHLIVAVEMAMVMIIYAILSRKINIVVSAVIAVILNGVGATALLIPILGTTFFVAMVGPLTLIATINVVLAVLVHRALAGIPSITRDLNHEVKWWFLKK